jgi:hypothetical protein
MTKSKKLILYVVEVEVKVPETLTEELKGLKYGAT